MIILQYALAVIGWIVTALAIVGVVSAAVVGLLVVVIVIRLVLRWFA